eukprot:CAMPEP_0172646244 /NCGR_PEP_ID=MMETSP1068-20121228/240143_1 /TAXON_ID=35684 /ORGANISM="Pseudopedinella elastica, Strain CCMP716" /LENGTH=272 /DNA_ID=CAMNT_0013460499 /DNA_START=45 /DNA_END=864 /DNA_ORIENTATION=-
MRIVGLTGGIACGKSTVSKIFRDEYKLPIVDADEIAHNVINPGTGAYRKILAAFGKEHDLFVKGEHSIDRKKLGGIVFRDEVARQKLVGIMNASIAWVIAKIILWHFLAGTSVLVLDVPLLFETGMHNICHVTVAVNVSPETQLSRLKARDESGDEHAKTRIAAQKLSANDKAERAALESGDEDAKTRIAAQKLSANDKAERADIVLDNNKGEAELLEEISDKYEDIFHMSFMQTYFTGPVVYLAVGLSFIIGAGFLRFKVVRIDIADDPEL